jgi:hypothetical protein
MFFVVTCVIHVWIFWFYEEKKLSVENKNKNRFNKVSNVEQKQKRRRVQGTFYSNVQLFFTRLGFCVDTEQF